MKKVFTKIAGLSVGLALAIGVGVAVGGKSAEEVKAAATAGIYEKVTSVSNISAGDRVIFVNSADTHALGDLNKTSGGFGSPVEISVSNSKITLLATTTVTQFVVEAGASSGFAFKAQNNTNFSGYYLAYTSTATSSSNYLNRYSSNTAANTQAQFTLTYSTDHMVINSVYNTGRYLRFNSDRFACYYKANGESTTGTGVNIWKYTGSPSSVSPTSIACNPQSVSVASTLNLADAVTFTPDNTTEKGLSFSIKSGSEFIDLTESGVVTGKKGGSAVVTITPEDTSAGATAIDVAVTVNSLPAPSLTIGDQYVIYNAEAKRELTGIASNNTGTATTYSSEVPSCSYVLTAVNGFYENTVAFFDGTKYLSLNSAANNLYLSNTINEKSSWVVSVVEEVLTVVSVAYPDRQIQYNANLGQERFACYTGGQTAISLYHFEDKALEDFTIESEIDVYVSGTRQIVVEYDPADASDKELTWTSANEGIATVDNDGVVTGVAVGEVIITASKTIGGNPVERTCTVTVLNNVASHHGTQADPFDVEDAVNVAKGIFVKDPDGNDLSATGTYYVYGLVTATVYKTKSNLTLWVGDRASQTSAATGAFEIFKAGKVYGVALADAYATDDDVKVDFNVGNHVLFVGEFTYYNNTTSETKQGTADITYCDYIEARKYATAFNAAFEAEGVCDEQGESVVATIASVWSAQSTSFEGLDTDTKAILTGAEASTKTSATAVEKCAAKYDYIGGKYNTQLGAEYDFMGRNPSPVPGGAYYKESITDNNDTMIIVISIAAISTLAFTTLFVFKKKKQK